MHRRSTITMAAIAPWWLLFVVLFACLAVHAKTYDVAVQVDHDRPVSSTR